MEVSFIVVNYKSFEYLNNCLKAILEKVKDIDFEIIIVNNDKIKIKNFDCIKEDCLERIEFSTDIGDIKKNNLNKKLKIIEVNKNIGFGKANNLGVLFSIGKYICFINPDTEIYSNNIKDVIFEFENNSDIGIVGPKIIQNNESKNKETAQDWSVGVDLNIGEILRSKIGLSKSKKFWKSEKRIEVDWVTGASMFIKKRIFLQVSGFDEKIFLYYEDLDLCKKVKEMKKKVIYYPDFKVLHLGGKSTDGKSSQKIEYFKSQDYYYKKWFSKKSYFLLKFLRFFYNWRYIN